MTQFNLDLINKWPTFGWPLSSSTSIAALSVYAVGGFDPKLALDFIGNTYRTGGADSTLANSVTHARAGHATMVDSDGLLKWAPHNLLTYSQDFSSWPTSPNVTITSNTIIAPDGTTTADSAVFDGNANARVEQGITQTGSRVLAVWMKVPSGTQGVYIGFTSGDLSLVTVTDQWVLYSYESASGTYPRINCRDIATVHIWGAHAYRRDLGGMANNPDTSNSYVPTTTSAVYAPRVGHHVYNGSAWVNEGVLHESEARTNYIQDSHLQNTSNGMGTFSTTRAVFTENNAVSPDGTTNAAKFAGDGSSNSHRANLYVQGSGTSPWLTDKATFSVYLKQGTHRYAQLEIIDGYVTLNRFIINIDLQTGTIIGTHETGSPTAPLSTIENVGNGWYRASATLTKNGDNPRTDAIVMFSNAGAASQNPVMISGANDYFYVWGAQLEAGAIASSLIPTSGSQVTRAAETLTVPAANLPYSSTNMSIQMDGRMTYADEDVSGQLKFIRWLKDNNNEIRVLYDTHSSYGTGRITFQQIQGGNFRIVNSGSSIYPAGLSVPFNIASRHGSSFVNGSISGTALTVITNPVALPDLSTSTLSLGNTFMGTIGKFRVWDEDLGDTGIATASSPSTEPSLQLTFDGSSTSSFKVLDWSE